MQRFDKIREARDQPKIWRFKVRVIRLWVQPNFKNPALGDNLEMVVLDDEGDKIQATVKQVHLDKFYSILNEMGSYIFARVDVRKNLQRFKPCDHNYRLFFQYNINFWHDPYNLQGLPVQDVHSQPNFKNPALGYTLEMVVVNQKLPSPELHKCRGCVEVT